MKVLNSLLLALFLAVVAVSQEDINRGVELYRTGNYSGAVEALEKFNAAGRANNLSYLYLGAAYVQAGKEKEARNAFIRAKGLTSISTLNGETPINFKSKKPPTSAGVPQTYESGETILAVEFKADKTIGFLFVVDTSTIEFINNCKQAAKRIKFEPATRDGNPVTVIKLVEYTFQRY